MVKISRITTQKKSKTRYNIFLNDGDSEKYGFSVDEAVLIKYRLRKDLDLEASIINELIQEDTIHKTYTQVIHFLSYRMRTEKEIYDYLSKKEVDPAHIKQIIDKLIKEKLIDDKQFAESFVRTRIQTTNKGPMLVKRELIQKGVLNTIASQSIRAYTYEIQHEKAYKLAEKKRKQVKKNSLRKQVEQIQAILMQKGFTQEIVQDIIALIKNDEDKEAEWEAIIYHGDKLFRKYERKASGVELRNKLKASLYRKGFDFELINKYIDEFVES
ncbi:recombination regulator RecX [Virgibacillus alimentarius]|uniref:Regulatory protein RecX n=1 Tax=Virgibacillus alimentarius TaxID=698769 RepID=A0ABS4SBT1_9BACI|nr:MULTISPECIES: recombination regulator RecX [Virgibacillus]MBP2258955.1 regulatory protein [Virgibacillus alimentarius]HLR68956.1 recombination regulator RecX [Virgibacillus sp.]